MTAASRYDTVGSRQRLRSLLLGGSALCAVVIPAVAVGAPPAMPTQTSSGANLAVTSSGNLNAKTSSGTVGSINTAATVAYSSTATGGATPTTAATVTLTAPRTLIDWTTYEVGSGGTLTYNFGNAISDIVINRVTTGSISIDTGGTVKGMFGGSTGGNIWFLAPNGVFINGTVTAAGVVASNNMNLADTELLGSSTATIMTDLAAGGGLIDLSGVSSASGASVDATGNIVLGGPITVADGGAVTASSQGSLSVTGSVAIGSGAGSSGTLTLATTYGGMTDLTGDPLSLAGNLTAVGTAGQVALNAAGTITQSSGVISTNTLTGSSSGATSLPGSNRITDLGAFTTTGAGADFSLTNANALSVTGAVTAGAGTGGYGQLSLTTAYGGTTDTSGDTLAVNAPLTATASGTSGGVLTLTSAGAISQAATGAGITAATLTGSAGSAAVTGPPVVPAIVGVVTLTGAGNQVANLGTFTTTGAGADFAFTDTGALSVTGAVTAGAGTGGYGQLSLTTVNGGTTDASGDALAVNAPLTATASGTSGGVLTLTSAGAISQAATGAGITAATLTGSAGSAAVTGPPAIPAIVGVVTLTGAGNQVANLGTFTTTGAGADFAFTDTGVLSVTGAVTAGAGTGGYGQLSLTTVNGGTTDASGDTLAVDAPLTATASGTSGGVLTLTSAGAISQAATGAGITAATLTGSAGSAAVTGPPAIPAIVGVVTLTGAGNQVANLGTFTTTGAGADFAFTDTGVLSVTGAVTAGAGTGGYGQLSLTTVNGGTTDASGDTLAVNAPLTATASGTSGGVLTLTSAGAISQAATGAGITAATLTGSAGSAAVTGPPAVPAIVGVVTLTGAGNQVANLGTFTTTGAGADFAFTDTGALSVTGAVTAGAGTGGYGQLSLTTVNGGTTDTSGDALAVNAPLTATASGTSGGVLTLTSAGAISQAATGAGITAATLTGSAGSAAVTGPPAVPAIVGVVTLTGAGNQVANLGTFTTTGAGADFAFTDTGALSVTGAVTAGAGTGGYGQLSLTTVNGGTTDTSGDALAVTSPLTATASGTSGGVLTLTSAGAISQAATGAGITAATLTGSAGSAAVTGPPAIPAIVGVVTLTGAGNQVANLGTFTTTGAGADFAFTDTGALSVTGAVTAGAGTGGYGQLSLTTVNGGTTDTSGDALAVNAPLTATASGTSGGVLTLTSAGAISQAATGAGITAATLTGSAGSAAVTGPPAVPAIVGVVTLTGAGNQVANLGTFTTTGAGADFSLTNGQTLTVTGAVVAGAGALGSGNLTLEATAGDLNVQNNLTASGTGSLSLTSNAGNLTASAAATLTEGLNLTVSALAGEVTLVNQPTVSQDYSITAKTLAGDFELDPAFGASGRDFTVDITATTLTTLTTSLTAPRNLSVTTAGALTDTAVTLTANSGSIKVKSDGTMDAGAANASAGSISFKTTTGDIDINDLVSASLASGGAVTLVSAGAISEQAAGAVKAATLTGSSVGATTLGTLAASVANQVGTLGSFQTGTGFSLTNAQTLAVSGADVSGLGSTGVNAGTGALTLETTAGGDIEFQTATGTLTAGSGAGSQVITLVAAGAVSQTGGTITGGVLTGSSVGATTLGTLASPVANVVGTLDSFKTGTGFSLTDARALSVSGIDVNGLGSTGVNAGTGALTLKTTTGDLDLQTTTGTLTAGLATGSQVITLVAAGAVDQTGGTMTGGVLTGSSGGLTTLGTVATPVANQIGTLDAFKTGSGFSLTNAKTLAVSGADVSALGFTGVNAGTGALTLETTTGDINFQAATSSLTAGASSGSQVITLVSAGAIKQTGGTITGGVLTGSSVGSTTLGTAATPVANRIGALDTFQAGTGFSLTDTAGGQSLAVNGPLTSPSGNIYLATALDLDVDGAITATAGTVTFGVGQDLNLNMGGSISCGGCGAFDYAADRDINIGFALSGAAGTLSAGRDINDSAGVTATGILTATAGRNITELTGGLITAGTLTGSSVGSTTLGTVATPVANKVGTLGAFQTGTGFSLTDAQTLTVSGADVSTLGFTGVNAGTGALTLKTTAGDIDLDTATSNLTAGSGTGSQVITLVSAGAIDQSGGIITGGVLTGSSAGATSLGTAGTPFGNAVGAVNTFLAGAGFSLTDTGAGQSLAVNGPLTSTTGNIYLATALDLDVNGAIDIPAGTLTLSVGRDLNLNAGGSITCGNCGPNFDYVAVRDINIGFALSGTDGTLSAGRDINDAAGITATATLAVTAGRNINELSGGLITAGNLTGSSTGSTTLGTLPSPVSNQIQTLGAFKTGTGFSLTDARTLAVTGADVSSLGFTGVNAGTGALTLKTTAGDIDLETATGSLTAGSATGAQIITLVSAGAIDQTGGTLTGGELTGSSVGSTTLGTLASPVANLIGTLGAFKTGMGFSLTDARTLAVTGADVSSLGFTGVNAGTGALTLKTTAGDIDLETATGSLTAGSATGAQIITLVSAGAIDQTGGTLTGGELTGSSVGSTTLGTLASPVANLIGTLATFQTGTGFSLTDARTLAVTGADVSGLGFTGVNAGTGALTLKTTAGDIDLETTMTAGQATGSQIITLVSAGAIDQTGGTLTGGELTGSSVGSTTLGTLASPVANLVGTLGAFQAGAGFSLTDARTLAVTGADVSGLGFTGVNAGTGALTLKTTAGDIDLETATGSLTAGPATGAQIITLVSAGAIDQTGGTLTGGVLTGSSVGSTTLGTLASPVANLIGTLAAFQTGTGFSLTDARTLAVTGADVSGLGFTGVNAGTGALTLKTTAGDIDLETSTGSLTAGSATGAQIITLVSAGAIDQTGGTVTGGALTGSSVGSTTLGTLVSPVANLIGTLGAFQAGAGLSLTDARTLAVTGADVSGLGFTGVNAGTGALTLKTTTGDIDLGTTLTAGLATGSQIITLVSAGAIDQTGGTVTGGVLTGSSVGSTTLGTLASPVANLIGTLGAFRTGTGFSLTDARTLAVTGADVSGLGFTGVNAGTGALTLETTAGDIDLETSTGSLTAGSATGAQIITLVSAGAIDQTGGTVTGGELTGSSVGSTALGTLASPVANLIGTLGAFQAGTGFSLTDARTLAVTGADGSGLGFTGVNAGTGALTLKTTAGDIDLETSTGSLTAGSATGAQIITLVSAGAIDQTGGTLTGGALTGSSVGSTTLGTLASPVANLVGTLGAFQAGAGFSLTDARTLAVTGADVSGLGFTGVNAGTGALTLKTTAGDIDLETTTGSLTAGSATGSQIITLVSAGAIDQTGGTLTGGVLTGSSVGSTTLGTLASPVANLIGTLAAFQTGTGFSLTDARTLAVTGADVSGLGFTGVNAGTGALTLKTTAGDIDLETSTGSLTAGSATGAQIITLVSAGAIDQTGGTVTGGVLTGSSFGSTTLGALASPVANLIGTLGAFQAGAGFSLTDARTLAVTGADVSGLGFTGVNAGTGALTLKTTTGDIDLGTNLTAGLATGSQIITLVSAGAIDQSGGTLTGGELTGSSVGSTTLGTLASPVANLVGTLGAFQAGAGFSLTDARTLAVTGADVTGLGFTGVNAGTGALTLKTTAGDIDLQTTTGSLTAGLATGSQIITLVSAGAIDQTGGTLTGGVLTGSSFGSTTLGALASPVANLIGTLGAFQAGAGLSLTDARTLAVTGADVSGLGFTGVNAGTGALTLKTTTGDIDLGTTLTAGLATGSQIITLVSAGAIDQTGGTVTGGVLTGSSVGSTTLGILASPVANLIGTLGAFRTGTGFSLTDARTLAVTGADVSGLGFTGVNAGTGALTLETTAGDIDLETSTGSLTAGSATGAQIITLVSAGAIDQTGGTVTGGVLTGSSVGSTTLGTLASPVANLIGTLGAFRTGTGFSLTDARTLAVTGADVSGLGFTGVNAGTGALTLKTTAGDIDLETATGSLTAGPATGAQIITLVSAGAIDQSGGTLTGGVLTGSSVGSTTLGTLASPVANLIGTLGAFQAGAGFSLTDARTLAVTGADVDGLGFTGVNAGTGALTLKTTAGDIDLETSTGSLTAGSATGSQIITLVSAGAIDQTGGTLTGGVLTGSSFGSTTLGTLASPVANLVGTLGAFQAGAGFSLTDARTLAVTGADVSGLGFTGVNAGTGALTLETTTGDIDLGTNLTAGLATGSQIITLVSAGAIDQTGGTLTGGVLTGSSVGSTTLGTLASPVANLIGTLGAFQAGAGFSLTDARTLAVTGADVRGLGFTGVNAGTGALTLETTAGDINLETSTGSLTAGSATGAQIITLVSAGAIDQTGGTVTGGVLTGSSVGSTTLGTLAPPVANLVGTLGAFHAGAGFSLTDARTLAVTGADVSGLGFTGVNAGTGALTLKTTAGDIDLETSTGSLTAGSATGAQIITLVSAGAIDQTGGTVTGGVLTGSSVGSTTLGTLASPVANLVGTLGAFQAGAGFSLTDARTLAVTGADVSGLGFTGVNAGTGALTLKTTAGDIDLETATGSLTAGPATGAQIITLVSAGAIDQTGGTLTGGVLTGSSVGSTTLGTLASPVANLIGTLGAFQTGTGFSLTDARTLAVTGADVSSLGFTGVNAGTGALTLKTTAGDIDLETSTGSLTAGSATGAQIITLVSAGAIDQAGGTITGGTLTGSSVGSTTLGTLASPVANLIGTLAAFQTGSGFSLTNAQALAVSGADVDGLGFTGVNAGTGDLTIETTAGDLDLQTATGSLTAGPADGSQVITLVSAGAIDQAGGTITGGTLTGSSVGSTTLGTLASPVANLIGTLAAFQTGTGFSLTNAKALVVSGADVDGLGFTGVDAGTGDLTIETTAGDLDLQTATGSLTAGPATGSQVITLVSAGAIDQTGGTVTGGVLTGSSVGSTTLGTLASPVANLIGTLGAFRSGAGFSLTDARTLAVTGADVSDLGFTGVNAGTGALTLKTTAGDIDLETTTGSLTAGPATGSQIITLVSAGAIDQTGGTLTGGVLTGSSVGSTTLGTLASPVANLIGTLAAFQTGTGFSLTDARTLAVTGADVSGLGFTGVNAGTGALTLKTTTGDIDLGTNLTAGLATGSQIITLVSAGAIDQTGGTVTGGVLTGSSVGSTTLGTLASPVADLIGTLGAFRTGTGFSLTDARTLAVTGADVSGLGFTGVNAGTGALTLETTAGDIDLETTTGSLTAGSATGAQIITLVSAGAIDQTGGTVTGGELTGSSVGSTALGTLASPVANLIGTLGAFQAGTGFSLTDARTLAVTGADVSGLGFTGVSAGTGALTLETTSGDLDFQTATGSLTAGPATGEQIITLVSAGAIDQTGGTLTGGVLTGSSVSSTTLGTLASPVANLIGTLAAFQTGTGFSLTNAQALVVSGADVDGLGFTGVNAGTGALTLVTTTGDLDLQTATGSLTAGPADGSQVITLVSAGAIDQAGGTITGGTLTGSSVGSTTLGTLASPVANLIGTLAAFQTGTGFSLTNAQALVVSGADVDGLGFTGVNAGTGDLTIETTAGDLDLQTATGSLTARSATGSQVITLVSAGAIDQAGGTITGGTLTGSSVGSTTLGTLASPVANLIGTLAAFQTGSGFSLTNAQALVVSGADVDGLGFTGVNAGTGDLTLVTTTGDLDLQTATGSLTAGPADGSQVITLVSAGAIDQAGGTITGGTLTGSSVGSSTLGTLASPVANLIGTLAAFQTGAGFSLTDARTLAVTGADVSSLGFTGVSAGTGALTLETTSGDLDFQTATGSLTAGPATGEQIITLVSAGAIDQTGGTLTGGVLTGSSVGSTTLGTLASPVANLIGTLAAFQTGTGFSLTDAQALVVSGADVDGLGFTGVNAGTGALTLVTTTGDLDLQTATGSLTAGPADGSQVITLVSAGAIDQAGGTITGGTLTGSSVGSTTLGTLASPVANLIGTLAAFQTGTGFSLTNAKALVVSGADVSGLGFTGVNAGTGDLTIETTAGDLDLQTATGSLTAGSATGSQVITLVSAGAIDQTGGTITGGTLTGSSVGSTTLGTLASPVANLIGTLAAFQTGSGFSLTNAQALAVSGADVDGLGFTGVNAGMGALTLVTTTGDLDLQTATGSLTAGPADGSQVITLVSAGAIDQAGGTITGGTLTGSSVGSTTLGTLASPVANLIGTLAAFQTGTGFSLTNAQALVVSGADVDGLGFTGVNAGTGDLTIETTAGDLDLQTATGSLTAGSATGSQVITLVSAGAIDQAGGTITGGTLTGSSVGSTTLGTLASPVANLIGTLAAFQTGSGFSLTNAQALVVSGADVDGLGFTGVNAGTGDLTLVTTTGDLDLQTATGSLTAGPATGSQVITLVSAGAIDQAGGTITGGTLTGSSVASTTLGTLASPVANLIGTLAAFQTGTGFSLTNAQALVVSGADVDGLGFNGVNAGSGALTLVTTTGDLDLQTATGSLTAGPVDGSQVITLVSAGAIDQGGGTITGGTLTGSSVGSSTLGTLASPVANLIGTLAAFQTGSGFSLTNAQALAVSGADVSGLGFTGVNAGTGDLTIETTAGDLDLQTATGSLTAGPATGSQVITLVSAGAIDQTGGIITGGVLTGSSVGGASFDNAGNAIGTLAGFTDTANGDLTLADSGALTIASSVSIGSGELTLVSAGAITQTGGVIQAGSLTGSSVGGTSLTDANLIGAVSGFTNATSGAITLTDAQGLSVSGTIDNASGAGGAGRDIAVTLTKGSLTGTGAFAAQGDVVLWVQAGATNFTSAAAGDDVLLRSAGAVTVSGALSSGTGADTGSTGAADQLLASSPALMMTAFGHAYPNVAGGGQIDVVAGTGNITLGTAAQAAGAGSIRLEALGGTIQTAALTAGGDVALSATGSVGAVGAAIPAIAAGGDVAILAANGSVALTSVSAGDDIVLRAPKGSVLASGALTTSGSMPGGLGAGDSLQSDLPLAFSTTQAESGLTGGAAVDVGAAQVTLGGPATTKGAGSDVRIVATGPDGSGATLQTAGIIAGGDVALEASDAAATAGVTTTGAISGANVVVVAQNGVVTFGGGVQANGGSASPAGAAETLFSTVNSSLDGLFTLTSPSIYVAANRFQDAGGALVSPGGLGIDITDPGGVTLTTSATAMLPGTGSVIGTSLLQAASVSVFGPATVNTGVSSLSIGSPINGSSAVATGADAKLNGASPADAVQSLNLYTKGQVTVNGKLWPATDDTVSVTIGDPKQNAAWTPSGITIVNDGGVGPAAGSIGYALAGASTATAYTSLYTFSSVSLTTSGYIFEGQGAEVTGATTPSTAFLPVNISTDTSASYPASSINPSVPEPPVSPTNTSRAVMIAANNLTVAVGGGLVQQNTNGVQTTSGAGFYLTGNLVIDLFGTAPPKALDLFGVFGGTNSVITGAAAADTLRITYGDGVLTVLNSSAERALYRINSCVIGELGNCTPTGNPNLTIPLDELAPIDLLSRQDLDLEDPTVTGAPNEEIWRKPEKKRK